MASNPLTIFAAGGDLLASEQNNNFEYARMRGISFVYGTTIGTAKAVYLSTDTKVYPASAGTADAKVFNFIGFTKEGGAIDTSHIVHIDITELLSGLSQGQLYYLSDTPGEIGTAVGTVPFPVGVSVGTTTLIAAPLAVKGRHALRTVGSENLQHSADTERTETGAVYTKVKEIRVRYRGSIRTKFDIKHSLTDADVASGRVYVNGVASGTEWTDDNTSVYVTRTDDISVVADDLVQLYIKEDGVGTTSIRNFRIYYDKVFVPDGTVITD